MKYKEMFATQDRVASQKQIAVLRADKLEELINSLLNDKELSDEFRAYILITLSCGLRCEEARALTRDSFILEENVLYVRSKVLKKRKKEERFGRIHPLAQEFIQSYIKDKVGKIVKATQSTLYRQIQKHLGVEGICNHSLRHSLVSYYVSKNMTALQISKLMHISLDVVERYSHLNEKQFLKGVF